MPQIAVVEYSNRVIRLILLLGNPGMQYKKTRHNAAWLLSDHLGWSKLPWRSKWSALFIEKSVAGAKRFIAKPQSFMNRSGISAAQISNFYRIAPDEILVVHDDVELEFGDVAWKAGGGLAGHNGLRSLADRIGSREFKRLRIGVGRPKRGAVSSYVLSAFTDSELRSLPDVFTEASILLESELAVN